MSDIDEERTPRTRPNILITGTPGTGKTITASLLAVRILDVTFQARHNFKLGLPTILTAEKAGMTHLSVGDLIKEHKCWDGRDEALDSYILDEDKLLDLMEPMMEEAAAVGVVADYHSVEFFPERWFDLVVVLRTNTNVLFDRLTERGYNETKRTENMTCEIMQVILEEARESYATEIVHEVQSNTIADMDSNVERLLLWIKQWMKDNNNNSE
eukprot:scaffold39928_cov45-Attheya_sp.AAC.3